MTKKSCCAPHPIQWKRDVSIPAAVLPLLESQGINAASISFDAMDVVEENRQQRESEQTKVSLAGNGHHDKAVTNAVL